MTVGSDAVLPCVASGYPAPEIRWSKVTIVTLALLENPPPRNLRLKPVSIQLEGELPSKCLQEVNVLTVPRVAHEDSGTYVCTASNKQGKVEAFTRLQVHGQSAAPSVRRHLRGPFKSHFLFLLQSE